MMADACSSAMEIIGTASPLSKHAVVAIVVIAGACSQALAAICGLLPNQMLRLVLGVREQNEAKGCTVGPEFCKYSVSSPPSLLSARAGCMIFPHSFPLKRPLKKG